MHNSTVCFPVDCMLSDTNKFDYILMVEFLHYAQLSLESLKSRCFMLILLDRYQLILWINSKFYSKYEYWWYSAEYPEPNIFLILY